MAHSIGKTIAELRKEKGWTQVELAEKLQVSDKAVSKWEKDDSYPSIEFLPVLASLFGVTIDYLITGATQSEKAVENTPKKVEEEILADDPRIVSALHDDILLIDDIINTRNYKLIKKAIETYPITAFEVEKNKILGMIETLERNDWRSLFKTAVDINHQILASYILKREYDICRNILNKMLENLPNSKVLLPDSQYKGVNAKYLRLRNKLCVNFGRRPTTEKIIEYIQACKQQVLDDCANLYDKESKIAELTKEYFESELEKENTEIVIIKLCVRLEAILRCDYHYEGEFSEMLNEYCSKHGCEDDGWGYDVEANFVKYLHKLRKCRNNIVHSEKTEEAMTIDEIKFCIEYICRMG